MFSLLLHLYAAVQRPISNSFLSDRIMLIFRSKRFTTGSLLYALLYVYPCRLGLINMSCARARQRTPRIDLLAVPSTINDRLAPESRFNVPRISRSRYRARHTVEWKQMIYMGCSETLTNEHRAKRCSSPTHNAALFLLWFFFLIFPNLSCGIKHWRDARALKQRSPDVEKTLKIFSLTLAPNEISVYRGCNASVSSIVELHPLDNKSGWRHTSRLYVYSSPFFRVAKIQNLYVEEKLMSDWNVYIYSNWYITFPYI